MTSLSDMHLLVIDDSEPMRYLLRCLLRAGGIYNVTEAKTAAEGLNAMRMSQVDLVILDWKMAPIDGLAMARRLRWDNDSPNPYVPILMLTAHTEASRVSAARDAGVTAFVKKPISARLLFERLTYALTDGRMYVRTGSFFGPDRRRSDGADHAGPFRRSTDAEAPALPDTLDLDDLRCA